MMSVVDAIVSCIIWLRTVVLVKSTLYPFTTWRTVFSALISPYKEIQAPPLSEDEMKQGCRAGIDTHADTCCFGKHCHILGTVHGKVVEAHPFSEQLGTIKNLPIVNACVAYDNPVTGETEILVAHNVIFVSDMENHLICPDQARNADIRIDLTPPKYEADSFFGIQWSDEFTIPLRSYGPIPYFHVRRPTQEELDTCQWRHLTPEEEWVPYPDEPNEFSYDDFNLASIVAQSQSIGPYAVGMEHPLDTHLFQGHCGVYNIASLNAKRKYATDPNRVAALFGCGLKSAELTLQATTQNHIRVTSGNITRKYRTRRSQLRYRQLSQPYGDFYADNHKAKIKSIRGFTGGTIFCNKLNYIHWQGFKTESETGQALRCFVQEVGVPTGMHTDNAKVFIQGDFSRVATREGIKRTTIEVGRKNENRAELAIREFKKKVKRAMQRHNMPLRLWCFAAEYMAAIMKFTASDLFRLRGRTPYELVHGYTPDISEYLEFELYEPIFYWDDERSGFPESEKHIGRWLGPAISVGQGMAYYILKANGEYIVRSTVQGIQADDIDSHALQKRLDDFDKSVKDRIGDYKGAILNANESYEPPQASNEYSWLFDINDDSDEMVHIEHEEERVKDMDEYFPNASKEEIDELIGVHVNMPHKDGSILVRVKDRKRDSDGNVIGTYDSNPILNTGIYEVEMPDGTEVELTANMIIENMLSRVDDDGYEYQTISDILDHRKDESVAVPKEEGFFTTSTGQRRRVITTKGWDFLVRWGDQTTSWISLADLKASQPHELAHYVYSKGLESEPAFAWWVKHCKKRYERFINKLKSRVRKSKNMKFGIVIPKTVQEALALDKENGNTLWADAIEKEKKNSKVAFHFLGVDAPPPPGYKKITCHMIFDVKFDLTRKARYVAGGHLTEAPTSMTYASVVSRESVRILFTIAALNGLDVKMCDIGNAYLNAETRERVYFVAGSEWGQQEGETVIIVRALYGLKTSGAEWKRHFADTLRHVLGFTPSRADDNVWMKRCKRENGDDYYSYILVYVDDVLCMSCDPDYYMGILSTEYRLKEPPAEPTMYLGANISKFEIRDSFGTPLRTAWKLSADSHIKKALQVVKQILSRGDDKLKFKKSGKVPRTVYSTQAYRPELDCSVFCDDDQWLIYNSLIGIARWICELGRIDILTETSELSSYLASPRVGHLYQVLHLFHYLEHHQRSGIVLDPEPAKLDLSGVDPNESVEFKAAMMKEMYPDAKEDIPPNVPVPLGKGVRLYIFVDANHAGDTITRRSRTGIIIFVNMAPISWLSQRQATVEASTFGSEFVAMRHATEQIKALRYKLRMFGVPLEGPANVFCDNASVVMNSSNPESTVKKKHHSIAYHIVRETVAMGAALVHKVETGYNLADLFTKVLHPEKKRELLSWITY